jgi:hypothetical protein
VWQFFLFLNHLILSHFFHPQGFRSFLIQPVFYIFNSATIPIVNISNLLPICWWAPLLQARCLELAMSTWTWLCKTLSYFWLIIVIRKVWSRWRLATSSQIYHMAIIIKSGQQIKYSCICGHFIHNYLSVSRWGRFYRHVHWSYLTF